MIAALVDVVAPVFVVVWLGYLFAGRRSFPVEEMTDLIIYVTAACLVFDSLANAPRFELQTIRAPLSALGLALGGLLVAALGRLLVPALRSLSFGAVALPIAFINSGNLGLPLARLSLGEEGFQVMLLFFVVFSALHGSLGVALAKGRGGLSAALRLPIVYAALAGILVNQHPVELPNFLAVPIHLLGQTVIPMMLLALGARMRTLRAERSNRTAIALPTLTVVLLPFLRLAGGLMIAVLLNELLGNEGLIARITLLAGALPPAVMNFAVVEKFGRAPEESAAVAASIMVGTLASVVVLPVVIGLWVIV